MKKEQGTPPPKVEEVVQKEPDVETPSVGVISCNINKAILEEERKENKGESSGGRGNHPKEQ